MMQYYDRKGRPITEDEHYAALDRGENTVARDVVNGETISTVLVGMACTIGADPPLIFETLVPDGEIHYATQEEARAGHWAAVERMKAQITTS